MTIIEFYDKVSIENIAGALLCRPERVILVGDKAKQMARSAERYRKVLQKRGIQTEIQCREANKNQLQNIVEVLSQVVGEYEDCVFDLTGGEDLYLVAVGTIMERFAGRVQCHRFNFRSDTLQDCDADGSVSRIQSFDISIEENINIYGGEVVTDPAQALHTYPWDFNPEFVQDIDAMWDICRKNTHRWNAHINTIGKACELFPQEDPLTVSYNREELDNAMQQRHIKYACVGWIMQELENKGLIRSLVMQDTVSFTFKNEQVKQCLTIAGQILELAVANRLRVLKDKDGQPLYHDIRVGVVIDWDTAEEEDEHRTINEIDVIAMKSAIPVFISCKNGFFDANELYKLNSVAERFGNKYAKKVLVSTDLKNLPGKGEYLLARMGDMGIRNVDNVDDMLDADLERAFKSLWCN